MKLQNITVIFIIIVLPIMLVLSSYTNTQIDTLTLQNQYDTKLMNATYDGVKAFEINTSYDELSNTTDALKEDVEAAISAFMQSLAVNIGVGGYNIDQMRTYVPAVLFTLYDGYYIYAPTKVNNNYEYVLRPYNYYTVRYKESEKNDVVINYSLDNYMVIYGWIDNNYVVKSGYLINDNKKDSVKEENNLKFTVPISDLSSDDGIDFFYDAPISNKNEITQIEQNNGKQLYPSREAFYIDPESAIKYYNDNCVDNGTEKSFTTWVKDNLGWIKPKMAMRNNKYLWNGKSNSYTEAPYTEEEKKNSDSLFEDDTLIFKKVFEKPDEYNPEDSDSLFSEHKSNVIKNSIQDNLNQAITAYSEGSTNTYEFKLPKLKAEEWNTVSTNICMLTFLQGIPCGTKYYNNYALITSSTNKLYTTQDNLYFTTDNDEYYHKIDCPYLCKDDTTNLVGYPSIDFETKRVRIGEGQYAYYYRHIVDEDHPKYACYNCIVSSDYDATEWKNDSNKSSAYYTALARTKYMRYKSTSDLKYDEKKDKNG